MSQSMNNAGAEKNVAQADAAIADQDAVSITCIFFIAFILFT